MTMRNDDKGGRGLFGLGARRASPDSLAPSAPNGSRAAVPYAGVGISEEELAQLRHWNMKALAGAASLQAAGREVVLPAPELELAMLNSRPARYADVQSPWLAYWAQQIRTSVRPHRKLWEFAAILQTLYESGVLVPGARGLGFGVADEPLPSYFAGLGVHVLATDLPDETERERMFNPALVDAEVFDRHVEISNLDFRRLDDTTLRGFDFCWSSGTLSGFSSFETAAEAVVFAMETLKPGGVAVHTLDFAFAEEKPVAPEGGLAFPRRLIERLADQLDGRRHEVLPLDFGLGDHPLDGYVDLEPFEVEGAQVWRDLWRDGLHTPHLKLCSGGVLKASFVLAVRCREG